MFLWLYNWLIIDLFFFFSSRRRHTRCLSDWSSDVCSSDLANGAIAVDTWHLAKLGIEPEDLRQIPSKLLGWVELSDGQYENMPDPIDEVVNHRRLPGEGEFPIPACIEVCREIGY